MLLVIPVINLTVPMDWRVGRLELRPPEWLRERIDRERERAPTSRAELFTRIASQVSELKWAVATVEASDYEQARSIVQEHVAVLRLYQRARYRYVSLDAQTFGLPDILGRFWEEYYAFEDDRFVGTGFSQSGVLGSWAFSADDVHGWPHDKVFAHVDVLLRRPADERKEAERRFFTALAMTGVSTRAVRATLRHVLYAAALEALLGDEPQQQRTHRIAVRSAYLTCDLSHDESGDRHGPARPACPVLAYASEEQMRERIRVLFGDDHICTYYEEVRAIFRRRNVVLHEAREPDDAKPESTEWWTDKVLLAFARALADGVGSLADLDREIAALVAVNSQLSDFTFARQALPPNH